MVGFSLSVRPPEVNMSTNSIDDPLPPDYIALLEYVHELYAEADLILWERIIEEQEEL